MNPISKFYACRSTCNSSIEVNDMADDRKALNGKYGKVATNDIFYMRVYSLSLVATSLD